MRGVNRTFLIGRLGRDPELRTSSNGTVSWCTFTLATGRSRKAGDEWIEDTDWHRIKVFGTQAELCHRYLKKGATACVEGAVVYDTWTDKQGVRRHSTVIMADRVQFLGAGRRTEEATDEVSAQEVAAK